MDDAQTEATAAVQAVIFWQEYAPILEREGRLTDQDYASFEMLCRAYGALHACERQIAVEGETIMTFQERGDNQRVVKHPAAAARNENSRRFLDLADRFGLNPKARGQLRAGASVEKNAARSPLLD
jgi:P27 family predicted phage terminase small subunit